MIRKGAPATIPAQRLAHAYEHRFPPAFPRQPDYAFHLWDPTTI